MSPPGSSEPRLREPSPSRPDLHLVRDPDGQLAADDAPQTSVRTRVVGVDAARMLATLGVIWCHVVEMQGHGQGWAAIGRFGTSFYVAVLGYLGVRAALAHPERTPRDELRRGWSRLLVPFVAWCLIYGCFYGQYAFRQGIGFRSLAEWWGPFAGTARHLWFLPFAWACGGFTNWLSRKTRGYSQRELGLLVISCSIASYTLCYGVIFFLLPRAQIVGAHLHRIDRWVEEFPLLLTATTLSLWWAKQEPVGPRARWWASAALFVVLEVLYGRFVGLLQETTHHLDARYASHAAGLALLAACLAVPKNPLLRLLAPLRHVTYFTFLAHLLILEAAGGWLYNTPGFGSLPFAAATTLTVFTVAGLLGAVVRKVPGLRRLVGAS